MESVGYRSKGMEAALIKKIRAVWLLIVCIAFALPALTVLAPVLREGGYDSISTYIYRGFGFLCHQLAERSFHLMSQPLAVCARCFGLYLGLFIGVIAFPFIQSVRNEKPLSRTLLFVSMIPMGIDWGLGALGIWENTHVSRFLTGLIAGTVCALFITSGAIEIIQIKARREDISI